MYNFLSHERYINYEKEEKNENSISVRIITYSLKFSFPEEFDVRHLQCFQLFIPISI